MEIWLTALVILFVCNFMDWVLTYCHLALGNSEANPIANWLIQNYGMWSLLAAKIFFILLLVLGFYLSPKEIRNQYTPLVVTTIYIYAGVLLYNGYGLIVLWK